MYYALMSTVYLSQRVTPEPKDTDQLMSGSPGPGLNMEMKARGGYNQTHDREVVIGGKYIYILYLNQYINMQS